MKSKELLADLYKQGGQIFWKDIPKEERKYFNFLKNNGLITSGFSNGKKALIPRFTYSIFQNFNFVSLNDLGIISMVAHNENKYQTVIFEGIVKDWVSIGWMDLREATNDDYLRFPIAII